MNRVRKIRIKTSTVDSTIYCGQGAFLKYIKPLTDGKQVFIITDSNVHRIYKELIESTFGNAPMYIVKAGEKSKNERTLLAILKEMVKSNLRRNAVVVALGGGVIGDIGGLCASLYMRGIKLIQVPTTLLAQVDSSVGGKTAIDFLGVKNIIGTFYQPQVVLVDNTFLKTLPKREIRCGLGEIVKYGALSGDILDKLNASDNLFDLDFLKSITYDCILHKAYVVKMDEKETTGLRATLNCGHTTGHSFELSYKTKSHGEYVLIGMYYELFIAVNKGVCTSEYASELIALIEKVIKLAPLKDVENACLIASHDKKNTRANEIALLVPKAKNETTLIRLPMQEYIELISLCNSNISK